jgi:predicted amidohydrolase
MKVTTIQIAVRNSPDKNLNTILKAIQANANDTDWLVLPESVTTNWCRPLHNKTIIKQIEDQAKLANINIAYGTPWQNQNVVRMKKRDQSAQIYAKRWLAGMEHKIYKPGDRQIVVDGIAPLICNDFWATPGTAEINPYLPQLCARQGANILFCCANTNAPKFDKVLYDWHDANLRTWAKQLGVWVVVSNPSTNWDGLDVEDSVQCPTGIINPVGDWVAKCMHHGEEAVSFNIK